MDIWWRAFELYNSGAHPKYLEELAVLLHFDEISVIWRKCITVKSILITLVFCFFFFSLKEGFFKRNPDKNLPTLKCLILYFSN